MTTDWQRLWQQVAQDYQCDPHSIHGPAHRRRVERNGLIVATRSDAIVEIVRLFAVFHDSRRENEGTDPAHGSRGAAYAATLRGKFFKISDGHFELLQRACAGHTDGTKSNDATVGTCWDADRLDLWRVGIEPAARFMSTAFGKEIAGHERAQEFLAAAAAKTSFNNPA